MAGPRDEDNPSSPNYNPQPSHGELIPVPDHPGYFYNPHFPADPNGVSTSPIYYKNPDGSYTIATGKEGGNTNPNGPGPTSSGGGGGGSGGGGGGPDPWQQVGLLYGYTITPAMVQTLTQNGLSPSLLQQRLESLKWVNDNKDYLDQFDVVLQQEGLLGKGKHTTDAQRLQIATRQANPEWLKIWETASGRAEFDIAGITRKSGDVGALMKAVPGELSPNDWRKIAQNVAALTTSALEEGHYAKMGLSRRGLERYAAGVGGADLNAKVDRLLADAQARGQQAAEGQIGGVNVRQTGLSGLSGPTSY